MTDICVFEVAAMNNGTLDCSLSPCSAPIGIGGDKENVKIIRD